MCQRSQKQQQHPGGFPGGKGKTTSLREDSPLNLNPEWVGCQPPGRITLSLGRRRRYSQTQFCHHGYPKFGKGFFYRAAESQSLVLVFVVMFLLLAAVVGGGTDLHLSFAPVFAQDSGSTEANKMSPLSRSNSQEQQK